MSKIHPTALIHPSAALDESVEAGPYCVIGPDVLIGAGTRLQNGVTIDGLTTIGRNNTVSPYAVLGNPPQDKKHSGDPTRLVIGDNNVIREFVTMHTGTTRGGGVTTIGSNNLFMVYSHVAHDCIIEDNAVLSASVLLAGHVKVETGAVINGAAAVNQFVTIGRLAYVGGLTRVIHDVPPYMITEGHPQEVRGVNVVGMQRNGYSDEAIARMREAYRLLFDSRMPWLKAVSELESRCNVTNEVRALIDCLRRRHESKNGRAREALRAV